jgi:hypothetical protein
MITNKLKPKESLDFIELAKVVNQLNKEVEELKKMHFIAKAILPSQSVPNQSMPS